MDDYFSQFGFVAAGACSVGKKKYIGDKVSRTCRFCCKSEPEVTFRNEAHAIPRFFGNKQLVLRVECDSCNSFTSRHLEDHLDKYTRPFRTFGFVKGRESIPGYLGKDESRIRASSDHNIKIVAGTDGFITADLDSKLVHMILDRPKFIPARAYKALCKIAVSTVDNPSAVEIFRPAIEWCMSPEDSSPQPYKKLWLYEMKIPGGKLKACIYRLLVRLEPNTIPNAVFIIGFGHTFLQIAVPTVFDKQSKQFGDIVPFYPDGRTAEDYERFGRTHMKILDFSSEEPIHMPEQVTIRFQEYEEKS